MIYTNQRIKNYQFVTILADASKSRYYFPDLPNLRDAKVLSIAAYNAAIIPKDIYNVAVVGTTDWQNLFITLYSDQAEKIQKLDISYFNTMSMSSGNQSAGSESVFGSFPLDGMVIDFSKSYVEFASGLALITAFPFSFSFGIFYYK